MSIKYITTGDERIARGLLGEGRHQLSILKNAMTFQNLQQLQRTVRFDDGTAIKCSSCFGQDVVNVFVPPVLIKEEEKKVLEVFKVKAFFEFKLTRSDGVEITEESDLLLGIWVYNSEQAALEIEKEYNVETGYWEITVVNPEEAIDRKGYWVKYICKCGAETQYSGITITEDKWQKDDLIQPGRYEDTIPLSCFWFKVIRDEDGSLIDDSIIFSIGWEDTLGNNKWVDSRLNRGLVYDSDPSSPTYQHWCFEISSAGLGPAGYWITFMRVTNSIRSQYPKRVRSVEMRQSEDLLQPGVYDANVPVWIMTGYNTAPDYERSENCWMSCEELHSMADHMHLYKYEHCDRYYTTNKQVTETINVISSVPYMVSVRGNWNGQIQTFGSVENAFYYANELCPAIIPDRACFSWEIDRISLSGSGGMSVNWRKGEEMPVSDEKQFIASGDGSYSVNVSVTVSNYEYLDECMKEGTLHQRTVEVPWEKIKTSGQEMRDRVTVSAEWEY